MNNKLFEKLGITPGQWCIEHACHAYSKKFYPSTIRTQHWDNDMMGDYRGSIIADFTYAHGKREHAFSEAYCNAKLIVAAPEMLEHLIKAAIEIEVEGFYPEPEIKIIEKATGRTWEEVKELIDE